ncbi:MAG TPA: hypothetical protein ENF54_05220 [Desulfobacteraceae bacterium]|nr:hypothetical protein [Desulfobacteraceae bacterium]
MSIRVQVILDESEAALFRAQAKRDGKSLSAWLREAGKRLLEERQSQEKMSDPEDLRSFFQKCNMEEKGREPDWEEYKRLIEVGYAKGGRE